MEKAIMAHLAHTGSITDQVIKLLPHEFVYGSGNQTPATFAAIVDYVLDANADEINPALDGEMAQTASRLRALYEQGRTDPNVMVAFAGITRGGDLRTLVMHHHLTDYMGEGDDSLLRPRSSEVKGLKQEYDALELRMDDQSKGGYDTHLSGLDRR